nr:MAG TPA: 26S proteasome regulatory subunit [Caudoviricetes sp.]
MIYEVNVRIVTEGKVFVEAETENEARKAATSEEVVSKADFPDVIDYYADEVYNADSTVGDQGVEVIKAKDML